LTFGSLAAFITGLLVVQHQVIDLDQRRRNNTTAGERDAVAVEDIVSESLGEVQLGLGEGSSRHVVNVEKDVKR
jgi:hypothetical protein